MMITINHHRWLRHQTMQGTNIVLILLLIGVTSASGSPSFDCRRASQPASACNFRGTCVHATGICNCDPGWITFKPTNSSAVQCNYERESVLLPFVLSFFFGYLGVGPFMVCEYGYAIGTLLGFIVLMFAACAVRCRLMCCDKEPSNPVDDTIGVCGTCFILVAALVTLAMMITNIVKLGTTAWTDCNGAPMRGL